MTIPDGYAYESLAPAFLTVEQFEFCSQMILEGDVVDCAVERVGGYRATSETTEFTDILFGDDDRNEHVFPLVKGDYEVLRIVNCPTDCYSGKEVYFTMVALCGAEPVAWQRFPVSYGSDAYNMTVISTDCRRRIRDLILDNEDHWNLMCYMILGYDEVLYKKFETLGFCLGSPNDYGEAVFTPTSKVASFYLGFTAGRELVAIKGRWL